MISKQKHPSCLRLQPRSKRFIKKTRGIVDETNTTENYSSMNPF